MFCRNCGVEISDKAEICTSCGCRPLNGDKYCQECGADTTEKQEICLKCGVRLKKISDAHSGSYDNYSKVIHGNGRLNLDFSGLSPYYQDEFKKIYESNEDYKGKWNWAAFLLGIIWTLFRKAWLSAVVAIIVSIVTGGIFAIIYWFICGFRGNYMYYNAYVKKKQLFL